MSAEPMPEIKTEFAISELLLLRLPEEARPMPTERTRVVALNIKTEARLYRFVDNETAAKAWSSLVQAFNQASFHVRAVVGTEIDGFSFTGPIMVLEAPTIEKRLLGDAAAGVAANFLSTTQKDMEVLGRFSRLTGLQIRYCLTETRIQPPMTDEPGVLYVHVGVRPPGIHQHFTQPVKQLFDLPVWAEGEERCIHGPTQWRGRLVSAEGVPCLQIIGSNIYQMALPLTDAGHAHNRGKLWEEMLFLLAQTLMGGVEVMPPEQTLEEMDLCVREMIKSRSADVRKKLEEIEQNLYDLQRQVAEKLRERAVQGTSLKALDLEAVEFAERASSDFERIRAMPDVVAVRTAIEEGILVETVPIIMERNGRRYDLGPFRIHLSMDGRVEAWSETPKHPEGHHHPHIDKKVLDCFGNIRLAILKHAMACRFADTVELALRWLRSYHADLAFIPLETFPSIPIPETSEVSKGVTHGQELELHCARIPSQPEGRSAGDADRGRVGRKPRRVRSR